MACVERAMANILLEKMQKLPNPLHTINALENLQFIIVDTVVH